jgi:hypothetical protein
MWQEVPAIGIIVVEATIDVAMKLMAVKRVTVSDGN